MNQKSIKPMVFFLEDDEFFAQSVILGLENKGFEVAWCNNGESLLNHLKLCQPDAIVLDYHLGKDGSHTLNGGHFLDILKAMYPAIPVLMLTSLTDTREAIKLLKTGALDFIRKDDLFFENLLKSLSDILRARELSRDLGGSRSQVNRLTKRLTLIMIALAVAVALVITLSH